MYSTFSVTQETSNPNAIKLASVLLGLLKGFLFNMTTHPTNGKMCVRVKIGRIYIRDESSVWEEVRVWDG